LRLTETSAAGRTHAAAFVLRLLLVSNPGSGAAEREDAAVEPSLLAAAIAAVGALITPAGDAGAFTTEAG